MKKRVIATLLTMALLVSGLAGCGSKVTTEPAAENKEVSETAEETEEAEEEALVDTSKEVELTMYILGEPPVDNDKVFELINAKMKEKINATINVKYLNWSEYQEKYPLLFASGEKLDLVYCADWMSYDAHASKDAFWEITDEALDAYAPITGAQMHETGAWDQSKVNGKVYMVPMYYDEVTTYMYYLRGDLMEKYNIEKITDLDEFAAYLDAVAQNEDSMIPLDIGGPSDFNILFEHILMPYSAGGFIETVGPYQAWTYVKEDGSVASLYMEDGAFVEAVKIAQDWQERGFWSKSAAMNTGKSVESFDAGVSASASSNFQTVSSEYSVRAEQNPDWKVQVVDFASLAAPKLNSYLANGMCIYSRSENPERALMALELLRNDEEIHNWFSFGIEGEHYNVVSEGIVSLTEKAADYGYDGNCNWGIRNMDYWMIVDNGIENYNELKDRINSSAKMNEYSLFTFNTDSVKNEFAAISEIYQTDVKQLELGFTDDVEGDIAKLREKLIAAGIEEYLAELNKQLDEWKATR